MEGKTASFKRGLLNQQWDELVDNEENDVKENLAELLREISLLDTTFEQEKESYSKVCENDNVLLNLLDGFNDHKTGKTDIAHNNEF